MSMNTRVETFLVADAILAFQGLFIILLIKVQFLALTILNAL